MRIFFVLLAIANSMLAYAGIVKDNMALVVWAMFGVLLSILGMVFESE